MGCAAYFKIHKSVGEDWKMRDLCSQLSLREAARGYVTAAAVSTAHPNVWMSHLQLIYIVINAAALVFFYKCITNPAVLHKWQAKLVQKSFNHICFVKVDCMEEALQRSKENSHSSDLKVSILLDYTRGSRGGQLFP